MRVITTKLNMSPCACGCHTKIHVGQYDSDFSIVFELYNTVGTFTLEDGTTARIRGTKKSGTGYSADATIDIANKTVTVDGDAQMTAVAGCGIYEIVLYKDNKELSSANFIVRVEAAAMDEDTIADETVLAEIRDFDEQIAEAQAVAESAAEIAENISEYITTAETAATNASESAQAASDAAENIANSVEAAEAAASNAETSAETAAESAETASEHAVSAQTAQTGAETAQAAAEAAQAAAEAAQAAAEEAAESGAGIEALTARVETLESGLEDAEEEIENLKAAMTSYRTYADYDGTVLKTVTCYCGTPQAIAPEPERADSEDGQYSYTFVGWSKSMDAAAADDDALERTLEDRTVYAAYAKTVNTYTVTWIDVDGTVLETDTDVSWGTTPTYDGVAPSYDGRTFVGWVPAIAAVTGDQAYTADYLPMYDVNFYNGDTLLQTVTVEAGSDAVYTDDDPVHPTDPDGYEFIGWSPEPTAVTSNMDCYAQWSEVAETTRALLSRELISINNDTVTSLGDHAFAGCDSLVSVSLPSVTSVGDNAFHYCRNLTAVNLPVATSIGHNAFYYCDSLASVSLPSVTSVGDGAFKQCKGLTSVDLPVATAVDRAFQWSGLVTITLPVLTEVGDSAFLNCYDLTTVDLPSVTKINSRAFRNCAALQAVILRNTAQVVTLSHANAFSSADNAVVYVPDDLVDDYKSDNVWSTYADRIKGLSEYTG